MTRSLYSPRLGRMSSVERAVGRYMRGPEHDIDITQDLTDGSDGGLADVIPQGTHGGEMAVPEGAVPAHGADVKPSNQQQQPDTNKEPSVRDLLSSAFKAPDGQPTDQQQAQSAQAPAQQPPYTGPVLTQDAEGKWRQPDGLFASAEQVAAFQAAQSQPQQSEQQQQPQSPVLTGLTPVEQQQFQSLPAELRQFVERTMEGLNTRAAKYGEYDMLEQHIFGPRREAWGQQGMNAVTAVNNLFTLSDFASTRPGDFILWFAQSNNLDLDALLDERDAQQQPVDPTVKALQGTVQQLQGTLSQFQNTQAQQDHQARLNQVQTFAQEKDAEGKLKREYLTDVMDGWATQITAIRTANPSMPNDEVLQRAYDAACWADPAVRAKMQQAANTQQRQQEAQRVQAARQAGSSVTGGPSSASTIPNNANRTLREELATQFAEARAV